MLVLKKQSLAAEPHKSSSQALRKPLLQTDQHNSLLASRNHKLLESVIRKLFAVEHHKLVEMRKL